VGVNVRGLFSDPARSVPLFSASISRLLYWGSIFRLSGLGPPRRIIKYYRTLILSVVVDSFFFEFAQLSRSLYKRASK